MYFRYFIIMIACLWSDSPDLLKHDHDLKIWSNKYTILNSKAKYKWVI